MKLRDYQADIVAQVLAEISQGKRRILVGAPTGSGKTVTAAALIDIQAEHGKRSLFVVDRIELVDQAIRHLEAIGLRVGIMQGDNTLYRRNDHVVVCSIQTIRARRAPFAEFVVIDEANILHKAHVELMEDWASVPFVGLSATPLRQDLGKHFEHLIRGPSVRYLTEHENKYLVPAKAFCPSAAVMQEVLSHIRTVGGDFVESDLGKAVNKKELVGDIVKTWLAKASGRQTLVFAVDIAHSKAIIDDFRAEGVAAAHLDAYTPPDERDALISQLRSGILQLLSSVNVLGIGFDVPDASCAILARPTLSEALHMQQVGRVLRPAENKADALLLDHAGNTLRFGLPVDFVIPDLNSEDRPNTKQRRKQVKMVACTECGFAMEPDQVTCPACGIDRPSRKNTVHYLDGELVEFGSNDDGLSEYTADERLHWYLAMLWHARRKGRKDGWAYYCYRSKFDKDPATKWRHMDPVMPSDEQARWIKYYEIKKAKAWAKQRSA